MSLRLIVQQTPEEIKEKNKKLFYSYCRRCNIERSGTLDEMNAQPKCPECGR